MAFIFKGKIKKTNFIKSLFPRLVVKIIEVLLNFVSWCIAIKLRVEIGEIGKNINIEYPISTLGLKNIVIGDDFNVGKNFKLRAYQEFVSKQFYPEIVIGNNFYAGSESCVAAINRIKIGNNVTLASRVSIIDHSHGKLDYSDIEVPVMKRELASKGSIIIEDNVWICEGAIVLGDVTIGKNSIIAANAVVTHNIPAYSIAAGVPARIIKSISH